MPMIGRDTRQRLVAEMILARFGRKHATSIPQRAIRFLEEAIEAYQAAGANKAMAHALIDFVFDRPVGELSKEIGAVGLTLLGFASAAGLNADDEEHREVTRVLAMDPVLHGERNRVKNAAGFDVTGAYPTQTGGRTCEICDTPNECLSGNFPCSLSGEFLIRAK